MTSSKSTKRALVTSALAILACVAMLMGTTFAWFTDTASTAVNKIQAGNLKIALLDSEGNDLTQDGEKIQWKVKNEGNKKGEDGKTYHLESNVLWEPGCTFRSEYFYIKNEGNLALKYKLNISFTGGDTKLLEALEFSGALLADTLGTKTFTSLEELNSYEGYLLPEEGADQARFNINVHMKEEAGNEYQGLNLGDMSITVVATQYTYEYDSTGKDYDANAQYPVTISDIKATYGVDGLSMPDGVKIVDNNNGTTNSFTITLNDTEAFVYFTQVFDRAAAFEARKAQWGTEGFTKYPSEYNLAALNMWYGPYCNKITVKMGCDVDLNGMEVKPFGMSGYVFQFDGDGHTIKNAKVTATSGDAGFFMSRANLSNVVLDNIQVSALGCDSAGVVAGSPNSNITNVTVKNSSVIGAKYTGAIAGYDYGDITNCVVENTTVCGQYKVGGIVGYVCTDNAEQQRNITGNKLTDVAVKGDTLWSGKTDFVIGKIVGNWNAKNGTCKDNTFSGTTAATDNIGEIESGCTVQQ